LLTFATLLDIFATQKARGFIPSATMQARAFRPAYERKPYLSF